MEENIQKLKVCVFDFDKTLVLNDTTLPFFLFCCKQNTYKYIYIPWYVLLMVLSKMRILSIQNQKAIGLKIFCPSQYNEFNRICVSFSATLKLEKNIYNILLDKIKSNNFRVIIASASFENYLRPIFNTCEIIGSKLRLDKQSISGIECHAYGERKVDRLKEIGVEKIDVLYTDSPSDLPLAKISNKINLVKKGVVVKEFKNWKDFISH